MLILGLDMLISVMLNKGNKGVAFSNLNTLKKPSLLLMKYGSWDNYEYV